MINGDTKVLIIGFPDPFCVKYMDYFHHCTLKESLVKMDKHLDELNLDKGEGTFMENIEKVIFVFWPDAAEPYIRFENLIPFEECFDHVRKHCELEEYIERMEFSVCTEDKKPMFSICGIVPNYRVFDEYKYLEPAVLEIFNQYFASRLQEQEIAMRKIWVNGIMGVVVGDALGMPVQFTDREELKKHPVKTMEGYGTYNMPPGTWSDDSSMTLATLKSMREKGVVDYSDIMERFVRWMCDGEYTPAGQAFDQGNTCVEAICNYVRGKDYKTCGKTGEMANGNGALMRIMPACLWAYEKFVSKEWGVAQAIECVHQIAALTHNHLRSHIACGIYYFMVKNIIEGSASLLERLQDGIDEALDFYHKDIACFVELAHYTRLFSMNEFAKCEEDTIKSSGYVVDSLEAAVWSLLTTDTLEECMFKAVNLGGDSDTIGAIAGGLAALFYGYDSVPEEWRKQIVKEKEIIDMCKNR